MAKTDSTGNRPRQKKKSASATPKRHPKARKRPASGKRAAPALAERKAAPISVGRMERTRRLLLAALRVWELKRRVRE
jgi:hypothetical protein